MRWDDLKYLLAVADLGGLAAAARALAVDASTVSRRISALEEALATELVARTPEGMVLTEAGRTTVLAARTIEAELGALRDRVSGGRDAAAGRVRVTSTDSFATHLLRTVAPLHARFPALTIELVLTSATVDLRRRDADIAVRFFREEHDGLAIRKLGNIGWSLYATATYLKLHPPGKTLLDGHDVVGYGDELKNAAGPRWLNEHAGPAAVRMRCDGTRSALEAVLADIGVGLLPCYLAVGQPLVRLTDQTLVVNEAYAVFLPERRNEARIRVVVGALVDHFAASASAFGG